MIDFKWRVRGLIMIGFGIPIRDHHVNRSPVGHTHCYFRESPHSFTKQKFIEKISPTQINREGVRYGPYNNPHHALSTSEYL